MKITRCPHGSAMSCAACEMEKLRAEVERLTRERDALLKPHDADGTISCGKCGAFLGNDGVVIALAVALEERDAHAEDCRRMQDRLQRLLDSNAELIRALVPESGKGSK